MRGVEVLGIVRCHELLEWDVPEWTDDVVRSLDRPSLLTVEDLKASLMMAEGSRRAERTKAMIQDAVLMELVKIVEMDVPEAALMETAKVKYQATLLEWQSKVRVNIMTSLCDNECI